MTRGTLIYIGQRVLLIGFTLLIVSFGVFYAVHSLPGNAFISEKLHGENLQAVLHAYGLDRPIRAGLWATAASSVAILFISMISPTFLPFLGAMCVFLLGMGVVSPLATARALSPFGEKAGAASALLGFWQMMNAAIGVWLAATVSHEAMLALGVVLSAFSLLALGLYARIPRS